MQTIASMLQHNQSLNKVGISGCRIDSVSACCLAMALHSSTMLTELNMCLNSVCEKGALGLAEMLNHNTTLTVLNMNNYSVGKRGALAMAEILKHNTTLTRLDMSANSVGVRGALAMAEMFDHNTTLNELGMSWPWNSIGERGAQGIAEVLNTTQRWLSWTWHEGKLSSIIIILLCSHSLPFLSQRQFHHYHHKKDCNYCR